MKRSLRSIQANRQNALRSTGPRTRFGKLRVRRNALKHGLAAGSLAQKFPRRRIEAIVKALGALDSQSHVAAVRFAKAHLYWVKVTKLRRQFLAQKGQEVARTGDLGRRAAEAMALSDPGRIRLERYEKRALRSRLKAAQALGQKHGENL
jgi:hypothetical protein